MLLLDFLKQWFKKKEVVSESVPVLSKKDDVSKEGFNNKKYLEDIRMIQERFHVNKKSARKLVKTYYRSINK